MNNNCYLSIGNDDEKNVSSLGKQAFRQCPCITALLRPTLRSFDSSALLFHQLLSLPDLYLCFTLFVVMRFQEQFL